MTYINAHMCLVTQSYETSKSFLLYIVDVCWLFHKKNNSSVDQFSEKFEQLTHA